MIEPRGGGMKRFVTWSDALALAAFVATLGALSGATWTLGVLVLLFVAMRRRRGAAQWRRFARDGRVNARRGNARPISDVPPARWRHGTTIIPPSPRCASFQHLLRPVEIDLADQRPGITRTR
jgi:hypothetical protein